MQEILWAARPDLVIETGIAHGGSLIYHASLLKLPRGDGYVVDGFKRKSQRAQPTINDFTSHLATDYSRARGMRGWASR